MRILFGFCPGREAELHPLEAVADGRGALEVLALDRLLQGAPELLFLAERLFLPQLLFELVERLQRAFLLGEKLLRLDLGQVVDLFAGTPDQGEGLVVVRRCGRRASPWRSR